LICLAVPPCDINGDFIINENNVIRPKKKRLRFYGMSSEEAMEKYSGGMSTYRASEGESIWVDYKGPVQSQIQNILGGLRSACAYVGATRLKDLNKCATFVIES